MRRNVRRFLFLAAIAALLTIALEAIQSTPDVGQPIVAQI